MVITTTYAPGWGILALPIVGIIAIYLTGSRALLLWRMRNAKISSIHGADDGVSRFTGRIEADRTITSCLGGRRCVYSMLRAFHRDLFLKRTFGEKTRVEGFRFCDESGSVDISGSQMRKVVGELITGSEKDIDRKGAPEGLVEWIGERKDVRISEHLVPIESRIHIIADVKDGKLKPLLICTGDFYRAESEIMREFIGFAFIAFFSLCIGIAFAVILVNTY